MVPNDIDCGSFGSKEIIAISSSEENCVSEVSVDEYSSYFHVTGEIKNPEATPILPKSNPGKKYCTVLKNIHLTTWPDILKYQYHDVYYNLNPSCEEIEASVYNLVKFDTSSLACKNFEGSVDYMTEEGEMDCNRKGNIYGLFSASPERGKTTVCAITSNAKKFRQIQRCNIADTLKIRQIAIATSKKNSKKCVKGYSQSSLKLDFNPGNNSVQSSHPPESNVRSNSCRKSLFKTQVHPQIFGKTINSEITPNMPADWSIKKNRYTTRNIKPTLTLNPEKCISPSNQNKYNLALRKGLQRSLFLGGCEETSSGSGTEKSSSPERKSLCRFDSLSSEDMEDSGKTEKLSDKHRKKLREAVANALETHGINLDHPLFRLCGRNLFSICKSHLKDVIGKGRTSVQMKLLADSHVEKVIKAQAARENLIS